MVDVEGGNSVLFVSPSGESLLIDTGNTGEGAARDADRIMAAARDAGLTAIDHLITTHYHGDHVGGLPELAARIPIKHFIDYGPSVQPGANIVSTLQRYADLYAKATHTIAKPGEAIGMTGLDVRIASSATETIKMPLPGGGSPNPYCADFQIRDTPITEDDQSIGTHVTYGKFRVLHLADLQWNREFELMCPNNPIGTVDLWMVSRHGQGWPRANSEALVQAIRPRVAIMNNGIDKGGESDLKKMIESVPGFEDLWQIHLSRVGGAEGAVPDRFIANVDKTEHNGTAFWFKISAHEDGTFTVTNTRIGFTKTYAGSSGVLPRN